MGKICKSASASRSGRGQRGAFSTRASQGARPREATASDGPYLALRSARRMAVSWTRCQRNGQNLQKCVSFEKRARPAWGVFDTGKPGARPRESTGDVGPYLSLRSARRMAVSWQSCGTFPTTPMRTRSAVQRVVTSDFQLPAGQRVGRRRAREPAQNTPTSIQVASAKSFGEHAEPSRGPPC